MSTSKVHYCVGIDIGKDNHHVSISYRQENGIIQEVFSKLIPNVVKSYSTIVTLITRYCSAKESRVTVVMEATGSYYEGIFFYLSRADYHVSVILPNKIKAYVASYGKQSKNDKKDAAVLSRYGIERCPPKTEMPSESLQDLKLLTRHLQAIKEDITSCKNRLEANKYREYVSELAQDHLNSQIELLKKQVKAVEKAIRKHIKGSPELLEAYNSVETIHGISYISFAVIYAETYGFDMIKNARQLVSYAGYDVIENQSGKRSGKTKISKSGNSRIRRILFMPAFTAVKKKGSVFHHLYNRVYEETKIKMKAYVAVQRKLLTIMFAVIKKKEVYSMDYKPATKAIEKEELMGLLSTS
jgi:transposase